MLSMSRLLLESVVAHRIRLMPNVELLERTRVVGFRSDNSQRVTGVRVASAEQAFDTIGRAADLVVDATGRGSASPRWLEELGFKAPKADHIPARITYATCTFSRSESWPPWRGLVIGGAPSRRGAVVLPIERDLWLVSLAGYFDEQMPSNHLEFLEFARSLATPELYEALRPQEPMSDVAPHAFPGSQRRRYERLKNLPSELIVLGDALCSFNPVYGQGMTVSALEAEALDDALCVAKAEVEIGPHFARRWFASTKAVVDAAWDGVSIEDFRHPELRSERPLGLRVRTMVCRPPAPSHISRPTRDQSVLPRARVLWTRRRLCSRLASRVVCCSVALSVLKPARGESAEKRGLSPDERAPIVPSPSRVDRDAVGLVAPE